MRAAALPRRTEEIAKARECLLEKSLPHTTAKRPHCCSTSNRLVLYVCMCVCFVCGALCRENSEEKENFLPPFTGSELSLAGGVVPGKRKETDSILEKANPVPNYHHLDSN